MLPVSKHVQGMHLYYLYQSLYEL